MELDETGRDGWMLFFVCLFVGMVVVVVVIVIIGSVYMGVKMGRMARMARTKMRMTRRKMTMTIKTTRFDC